MRVPAKAFVAVVLVVVAACAGDEEQAATQVAVKNDGSASIDATVSDGQSEISFEGVAPGTTSNFEPASFDSLSSLTVTVGSATSRADLSAGARNVVEIGADGKVARVVTKAAAISGGSDDGW